MSRRLFLALVLLVCGTLDVGCTPVSVSASRLAAPPVKRILFIGNSYTYFNGGVDRILAELAAQGGKPIECVATTSGGKSLEWHWNNGPARELIARGGWDWVVLQDYSTQPLDNRELMFQASRQFNRFIRENGGRTAFYMTWARLAEPQNLSIIAGAYETMGKELGATVVPCGRVWERALKERPDLKLHRLDSRNHPTDEGSYLNACCFYVALLAGDPRGLPPLTIKGEGETPRQLSDETTHFFQRIAWEIVANPRPAAVSR